MIGARNLAAAWLFVFSPALAVAAPEHDTALQEAAIRLAVSRLGTLRDGFGLDERPEFQRVDAAAAADAEVRDAGWQDGLAPATEPPRVTIGNP